MVVCALVWIGGCKNKKPTDDEGRTVPAPGSPSVATAMRLDPEPAPPTQPPPPPEAGFVRIEAFDLDVRGATSESFGPIANVDGICHARIFVDDPATDVDAYLATLGGPKVLRKETRPDGWLLHSRGEGGFGTGLAVSGKAGATRYLCTVYIEDSDPDGTLACAEETCTDIRAVPGGAAERPYPEGAPVLSAESSAGDGAPAGGVRIWADGAVHFHGPACKLWRGRTGKLDAQRVAALIDAFRAADFLSFAGDLGHECCDCIGEQLEATIDGKSHDVRHMSCGERPAPFAALFDEVQAAVGANPCAP